MTILVTGGTGNTGSRLSKLLHQAGHDVLVASRSGNSSSPGIHGVKFDWFDPSTHLNPFTETAKLGISPVDRIYMVAPMAMNMLECMQPVIDLAIEKGVKRFVLLSSLSIQSGGPAMGQVHEYLARKELKLEWAVLRPTWFFENFRLRWLHTIRDDNSIPSTAGDGRAAFIAADDIAEAAVKALTVEPSPNTEWVITGPEFLTFDEVAKILSDALGRKVTHVRHTHEEHVAFYLALGLPNDYAETLSGLEELIAIGLEESTAKAMPSEQVYIGKRKIRDWINENKAVWQKN
ncbi:hypothetical protein AX16_004701 [Volvariella volvacea WC 439]|nr:hypothetical protein AX16_004701 [Volvariella volvacea WC 439]